MPNTVHTEKFSCAPFIKEIGRGKDGARGLPREQAKALYAAILRGEVSDFELGAVLIALRVKGETNDELIGFLQAIGEHWPDESHSPHFHTLQALNAQSRADDKPVVVIPSYNGARRKPNFTPLLAGLLAQRGYPVLVHGLEHDFTGRVTSAQVFSHLDWNAVDMPHPAPLYLPMAQIYPRIEALLQTRKVLGVRSCTHTLVKLMVPSAFNNALLVTSYTHPEFWNLQREVLCATGHTALVLRGHEGEPVAAPYRSPRMDGVKAGNTWRIAEPENLFTEQPDPHPDIDAESTARLIEMWLNNPQEMPHGFARQLDAIESVHRTASHAAI
ncbi:DNA-binding protein YbiB [Limnobacter sp.]|uniref:DNA-binding protein YbiB n=1 Tax=Limnobacter sp. TaxID=2003368 RepID=UPI002736E2E4|nr:DNA-binding protein YbiB [Limnobacter sp.]MDP3189748.1 DNA-binding protein YbiB [Limnobacter sp.]